MSIEYTRYLSAFGVSDIVRISSHWREEKGGLNDEHTLEEIACRKGTGYRRMKVHWLNKTFSPSTHDVVSDEAISAEDYDELCKQFGVLDSPEQRSALAAIHKLADERDALAPDCPDCDSAMDLRDGKYGPFWGCANFPRCKGTHKYTRAQRTQRDAFDVRIEALRQKL